MKFLKSGLIPVICLTIALSGCGGEEARKASFLKKGKTYLAQGDYDKAKVELKNVLQIDPKYAEAYYMMGLIEEQRQNLRPAFSNYKKASELDPTHIRALAKLGRFYLISGDVDTAKETLASIDSIDPQSMDRKLLNLLILSRSNDKNAIPLAQEILAEDPEQIEAIRILALVYIKSNEQDKAINVLKEGIANIPDEASLRLQLSRLYTKNNDLKNAEMQLKEIITLQPENLASYINLARFYAQQGKLGNAEQTLRKIISLGFAGENGYLLLADFQAKYKSAEESEKTLLSAITKDPEWIRAKFVLAALYRATGKTDKIQNIYLDIIELNGLKPAGLKARTELAQLLLSGRDIEGAGHLIEEVLDVNPRDIDALLLKGRIALFFTHDYDTAISAFRTIVKEQPDQTESVALLASAHSKNNEPELARETLARGIENAPKEPKAYINYAYYLQKTDNLEDAEKVIDKLLTVSPRHLNGLKLKVKFATTKHDMDEVRKMIENIKMAHPENPDGYQLMGDYYAANKKYKNAFEEYESALEHSKTLLPSLASIIKLHLSQKHYSEAITRLTSLIKEQPKNAIPHELLGEVFIAQKKFAKAEKEIKKAIELNDKWSLPYTSLADLYLTQKNVAGAIRIYKQALKALPGDTTLMARLARVYGRINDYESAIDIYEKIITIDSSDNLAANNLAVLLADKKSDPTSLQRAKKLALRFENSSNPGFLDTIGWIYYKTGEPEKALPILEKVVEKAGNVPIFQYHLGMSYYKTGNKDAARTHLNKSLKSSKNFPGREEAEQVIKEL